MSNNPWETVECRKDIYRFFWNEWCSTYDEDERKMAERAMDKMQPLIAASANDPAWQEFIQTLPNYVEYWNVILPELNKRKLKHG